MVRMANYQVLFSLRELAAIAYSKQVWCAPIPRRLAAQRRYLEHLKDMRKDDESISFVDDVISLHIEGHDGRPVLPEQLKRQLNPVIDLMGSKITKWLKQQQRKEFKTPWLKFCNDYICWTNNAFIDTSGTYRCTYNAKKIPASYKSWIILCDNCVEDCITDLWGKAKKIISKKMEEYCFDEAKKRDILIFYWFYKMNNDYENFVSFIECLPQNQNIYNVEESVEYNMFIFSVINCNYEAVKYFFEVLNENQMTSVMMKLCSFPQYCQLLLSTYKCEKKEVNDEYTQLIMFLLRQFSNYGMHDALNKIMKESNVVRTLVHWPWHDLFLRMIEEPERYHGAIDYDSVIRGMLTSMCKKNPNIHNSICRMVFNEMWRMNPDNFKQSINITALVVAIVWKRDIDILKTVINDVALREKRETIVRSTFDSMMLLSRGEMDFVDRFIEEVLVSGEERDLLRLSIANDVGYCLSLPEPFRGLMRE